MIASLAQIYFKSDTYKPLYKCKFPKLTHFNRINFMNMFTRMNLNLSISVILYTYAYIYFVQQDCHLMLVLYVSMIGGICLQSITFICMK